MIVRLAGLGAVVHMGQNAETEFRVLIEDFTLWYVVSQMGADKLLILEDIAQECAHFFPAVRAGFGFEEALTCGGELFESVSHDASPMRGASQPQVVYAGAGQDNV
jgi:hypothetical protein